MSAQLTLTFQDDGSLLYEHRVSKSSDERRTETIGSMRYMGVLNAPVAGGSNMNVTHVLMIMTVDTHAEMQRRLNEYEGGGPSEVWTLNAWKGEDQSE